MTLLQITDWVFPVGVVLGLAILLGAPAGFFLSRYIKPSTSEQKKEVVSLTLQTVGGAAFLLGAWFTWQQLINSRDALITTQQGQITDRFTRAIDQLGKDDEVNDARGAKGSTAYQKNLALRLGGIFALERIARDSKPDHATVMEVLTAFVRQHAAWVDDQPEKGSAQPDIRLDIQAILTVIGRRDLTYKRGESQRLNLSGTDLRWAILNKAKFDGVDLTSSHLENAQLKETELNEAILTNVDLTDAVMEGGQLQGADLRGAVFRNAKVAGANFKDAKLQGADLSEAVGLTQEQLNSAQTDSNTKTNSSMRRGP
jgi:hypothetical protein